MTETQGLALDAPRSAPASWRQLLLCLGPGFLIAVGYMDPGNWATDIAAGSAYGYGLLWVIFLANIVAMVLQRLALALGIASGRNLAEICRDRYAQPVVILLWVMAELAIISTDLAEVIGTVIALQLLVHLPLVWGLVASVLEVFLVLGLQRWGVRRLEATVLALMAIVSASFVLELLWAPPCWGALSQGLLPRAAIWHDPAMAYIAIGIVGATVMPHNLYLHSALVQNSAPGVSRKRAVTLATIDSNAALGVAILVNAAILVVAAAAFHAHGRHDVASLTQAHGLLAPLLGAPLAGTVFAVGLLASGLNATMTGTLAGQVVMEGFVRLPLRAVQRRLLTRGVAVIPAAAMVLFGGVAGLDRLLILSQVVLAIQLPFAAIPLLLATCDPAVMGSLGTRPILRATAWVICALLCALAVAALFS